MTPRTLTFRVDGEPQPFPKKEFNSKTKTIYARDKGGKKTMWAALIKLRALEAAGIVGRAIYPDPIFPRPQAIEIEIWVYRTQSKSNKSRYPTSRPDLDNLCYTPHNVLQGIIYTDDSQIIDLNEHKRWSGLPGPGMIITVTEVCGE